MTQRAVLNRTRNAVVPAANLPAEMLAIIFEFACCSDDFEEKAHIDRKMMDEFYGRWIDVKQQPYKDTCAVMRRTIGKLWSNVTIPVNAENTELQTEVLRRSLTRSGQHPLNVKLVELLVKDRNQDDEQYSAGISTAVIDVLATQAHRLHTIDAILPASWKPAFKRIAKCLPLLTRITLRSPKNSSAVGSMDFFSNAPRLRDVALVGYDTIPNTVPLEQLHNLKASCSDLLHCVETLRRASQLCHCSLQVCVEAVSNLIPLTHTKLRSLELTIAHYTVYLADFLDAVTLPALQSLDMVLFNMDPLHSFLKRSGCALQALHLCGYMFWEENLIECLFLLPELRDLHLYDSFRHPRSRPTQRLLDLMNPRKSAIQENECLVPNLETFFYRGEVTFTPHALVEFLEDRNLSKTPRVTKLSSVLMKIPHMVFEDTDALALQRLQNDGLRIAIVNSRGDRSWPLA
ncbi:hypothetical protein BDN70DRAFT_928998 [Pholiota conissans]|uniref:F-box domain-containing protein n=1 Tax=Pholiota conissans TaxID=109636 RepID=A0A9P5ZCX5_9AGAR|nr:hypothetical protein BDN70DRAFT_928998 [Pholiota conissans]